MGLPGDTQLDSKNVLDFLDATQLDRGDCFQYSAVNGARVNSLQYPVESSVKQEPWERFMEKQQQISRRRLSQKIGKRKEAIIDERIEDG